MLRWVGLSIVLVASEGSAELLPQYELERVCLHARLIVEARRVEPGLVEILKVHRGGAKVGERLTLRRFEDLPQRAFLEIPWLDEREKGVALYRWQSTVYWLAEVATPWNGASPRLAGALRWAVARRNAEVLDAAARGLARVHEPANVPLLAKALLDWPSGGEGDAEETRSARLDLVQCLGDHRLPACVPVLAKVLDDPDPEVADLAHACLGEIVGDDLGDRPELWLAWLAGLAK